MALERLFADMYRRPTGSRNAASISRDGQVFEVVRLGNGFALPPPDKTNTHLMAGGNRLLGYLSSPI